MTVAYQYFQRNKRLKRSGFSDYRHYLSSPLWKKMKSAWQERKKKNPKQWAVCRICEETEGLVLHHLKYKKIDKVIFSNVIPVCRQCHHEIHLIAHDPNFKGSLVQATRKWARVVLGSEYRISKNLNNIMENKTIIQGDHWNQLIDAFEPVNPMFLDFYKNKTERKALQEMAERIGFDKLLGTIQHLPGIVSQPFAPKITKPTELRRDLGKLIVFVKQRSEINKLKVIFS